MQNNGNILKTWTNYFWQVVKRIKNIMELFDCHNEPVYWVITNNDHGK